MPLTIAIAGRPNVGKSTLFNRLIGKQMALVDDTPGVTRDWREGEGKLFDLSFKLYDTAGLEDRRVRDSIAARTAVKTQHVLAQTDIILLVVDARAGLMDDDKAIAREIRKTGKPILLVGNKCEGTYLPDRIDEFEALGFGEPIPVSATHGEGMPDLFMAIKPLVPGYEEDEPSEPAPRRRETVSRRKQEAIDAQKRSDDGVGDSEEEKNLHVAIVGRPNVGKSTLINQLIGEDRMLTGPEPGLTRDAIQIGWKYKGKPVRLVDTAGLRRRARVTEKLEKMSGHETIRSIRLAHVVVLVIDAEHGFEKQDLTIAHHVAEEGRALLIAVNKWDAVKDKRAAMRRIEERVEDSLAQVEGLPVVTISALKGEGLDDLMKAVMALYAVWNKRISTNKLNRWLEAMEDNHPPPITQGRRIKLRYMTQIKMRPPTFQLWVNKPVDLPESYLRFLTHGLRDVFELPGVPIRWQVKKSANPYEDKKKR